MIGFNKNAKDIIQDTQEQEKFIKIIEKEINNWNYKWVVIFCGNYLLWINKDWECIACIPELYENLKDEASAKINLELCQKMDAENFDTKFSLFSLKMGLKIFHKLKIEKHILISADDKYIDKGASEEYFKKWFLAIPDIYKKEIREYLGNDEGIKNHLSNIVFQICDSTVSKMNDFLLSERYLVRRYDKWKKKRSQYREFFNDLWDHFTSCALEIFHLLNIIKEKRGDIFPNCNSKDKICVLMFVPDACTSSAMQWWLAVSRTDKRFDIINVTQTTTIEKWVMMITKITQWWVERL